MENNEIIEAYKEISSYIDDIKMEYIDNMTKDDILCFLQDMDKIDLQKLIMGISSKSFIEKINPVLLKRKMGEKFNFINDGYDSNKVCYPYTNSTVKIKFDEYGYVLYAEGFSKFALWLTLDERESIDKDLVGKNIIEVWELLKERASIREIHQRFYDGVVIPVCSDIVNKHNKKMKGKTLSK